ncbi:MAG: lamin tail domain-containing protein [Cyclobacteriaceae bacterium]
MKKIFIISVSLFYALVCDGQVSENFSDGDLTNSPVWTPDLAANWVVTNGQLQSNSASANSAFYITTPSAKALNAQWEFWINLQFNTSSANYVDVYLTSDQSNLLSATNNGYFVRVGGTPDEISLYKVTTGTAFLLINGVDGVTNSSNNILRIKVIRDTNNTWTLGRDATGGNNFFLEGSVTDNTFVTSTFFGIRIQQSTASFFNRHLFDNIYAGEIILDSEPPVLQQLEVLSSNQLSLVFNEKLAISSAQNLSHYSASNNLGNPVSAVLQPDEKSVILSYSQNFPNGISNVLTISGVQDLPGNMVASFNQSFLFFQPSPVSPKDIIITEIFADPAPQVGLPDAEFIELYNRSSNPINLSGWKISDGSSTGIFPTQIVLPGQYWIITGSTNVPAFASFGDVASVSNFPTLNNGGEAITLRSSIGLLVDSVNYTQSWYRDDDKKEGGWTLELIDTSNPCGEEDNWTSCEAPSGGTPGKINSINTNKPDATGPRLLSASVVQPDELLLVFNEKLEKSLSTNSFLVSPSVGINTASFSSLSLREIRLKLIQNLAARQLYTVTVSNLRDCNSNLIQEEFNELSFALPEAAAVGDLLINEILFNPRSGGVDFVEIINSSDKYINLKNWLLANQEGSALTNARIITSSDLIIPPGDYFVFTPDENLLINQYPNSAEEKFFQTILPSMNDDEGSIALVTENNLLIDAFDYIDNFHSSLLKDTEGVSLERISTTEPTQSSSNWKSANASVGFATPGYINSNSRPENSIDENSVRIEPEIFSPNVPGQDFARINYRFDQSGYSANIKIADPHGRLIKEIANNQTLGYEGFFRWDGDRDDGSKARIGYYFVWFEVFVLDGTVKTYRKRVVIGG